MCWYVYTDIDECLIGSNVCSNADCVNQAGSFICMCMNGYFHVNVSDLQSACSKLFCVECLITCALLPCQFAVMEMLD